MFTRILVGLIAAGAAVVGVPGVAAADPDPAPPPPPPPPVNSWDPVKTSDFTVLGGSVYAFTAPGDLTCIMSRNTGQYGCQGALPAAPDGANIVTGNQVGPPTFSGQEAPIIHGVDGPIKPLPAHSRISFKNITCGTDGVLTTCQNSFDQSGFVISPGGSFVLNVTNPLVDRPDNNRSPFAN
jgi:hypothetical protein